MVSTPQGPTGEEPAMADSDDTDEKRRGRDQVRRRIERLGDPFLGAAVKPEEDEEW